MKPYQGMNVTAFSTRGATVIPGIFFGLACGLYAQDAPPTPDQAPSIFQQPELQGEASPGDPRKLDLPPGETLLDSAASPAGPEVAILSRPGLFAHVLDHPLSPS